MVQVGQDMQYQQCQDCFEYCGILVIEFDCDVYGGVGLEFCCGGQVFDLVFLICFENGVGVEEVDVGDGVLDYLVQCVCFVIL